MPTVIDSLIVKLGLDPAGFTKGQKEAAEAVVKQKGESDKWRKSTESDAKKVTDAFVKFKKELIAVGVAWFGLSRIKQFSANLVTTGADVLKLSSLLGMQVGQLSLWEHAADKLGATSGEMANTFEQVTMAAAQFREGVTVPWLEGDSPLVRAGLDVGRFVAQTTTAEERVFMLSAALAKLPATSALLWGQQLGLTNNMIFALRQGPDVIRRTLEEQKKLNFETEAQAKTLLKMQQDWNRIVDLLENAAKQLVIAIGPEVEKMIFRFERWLLKSGGLEKIVGWVKQFAWWLDPDNPDGIKWDKVGAEIEHLVDLVGKLGTAIGGVVTAMGALIGARIGAMFGPWGALIGLIAGGVAPHVGDWLDKARENFRGTDTFKKLSSKPGFEGSDLAWLAGAPEAAKANPPVMPSAATIKPQPGSGAGSHVSTVSIGNVNVYTHATDAAGMAKGAKTALTRELSTVTQASGGGQ